MDHILVFWIEYRNETVRSHPGWHVDPAPAQSRLPADRRGLAIVFQAS